MTTEPRTTRHRTALSRVQLSRPVRICLDLGLISPAVSFFDYGCGRGGDVGRLRKEGIEAAGWDPAFFPEQLRRPADVVNLGYVLNVIDDLRERRDTLSQAWRLARSLLIVSARLDFERRDLQGEEHLDGVVSRIGTFQKFFSQEELAGFIRSSLGSTPVAAAPGVFLVFRQDTARQSFLASRFRRSVVGPRIRKSDLLFQKHGSLLQSLTAFVTQRGRLPAQDELATYGQLVDNFGSVRQAMLVVRRATGTEHWDRIRQQRIEDLLLYLALARFAGRPRFAALPVDMQRDVRDFFSSYKAACTDADRLLFATGNRMAVEAAMRAGPVGKFTGNALYVHTNALPHLALLLRTYEGCARSYLGVAPEANVIKLHRTPAKISYLLYEDFDRLAHPPLAESLAVKLDGLEIQHHCYSHSDNPPILHRKELLLPSDDPRREKYERLTLQEERAGLYADPARIGHREQWEQALQERGLQIKGHRLVHAMRLVQP